MSKKLNVTGQLIEANKRVKEMSEAIKTLGENKFHAQRIVEVLQRKVDKRGDLISHLKGKLALLVRDLINLKDHEFNGMVCVDDVQRVLDSIKLRPLAVLYKPRTESLNLSQYSDKNLTVIVWASKSDTESSLNDTV